MRASFLRFGKIAAQPFQSQHNYKEEKMNLRMHEQIVLVTSGIDSIHNG
jgi:hypothetical protein